MASHAMPGSSTTTPVPQCSYSNFKTRYYTMIFWRFYSPNLKPSNSFFFKLNVHHIHDWFFLISTIAIPVLRQQVRDPSNSSLQSWETLPAHQKEWTKWPLNPITLMPTTSLYSGQDWQPGPPGQIHHSWRARLPILATVLLLGSVATWFTPSGELGGFPMTAVNYWMGLWLGV